MASAEVLLEILGRPTIWSVVMGMVQLLGPISIAFLSGIMVGWVWKPRWASLIKCNFWLASPSSSSRVVHHPGPVMKGYGSTLSLDSFKVRTPSFSSCVMEEELEKEQHVLPLIDYTDCSAPKLEKDESVLIPDRDLEHLCGLVERKDGGPAWRHVMDRSSENMSYQAWQRDVENGPPQYCSRTVYEDATPELLRDFFWDDEFRLKWDDMLVHATILEECLTTGTLVVHWIRKFPFFCSDREYIIGRRIWASGRSYYCVTKGVPCVSVPRKDKTRRVDVYYSSWLIQAVESRKRNGELSACEIILFHQEEMGIPWEIVKFGVKQGMWGAVKAMAGGFRAYQHHRASGSPLSHHAVMARVNTNIEPDYLKILEGDEDASETALVTSADDKPKGFSIPKLLILGGVIALACSLDQGLLTKSLVFGVARKLGNMGRRAMPRTN